jgi:hypothetical protein
MYILYGSIVAKFYVLRETDWMERRFSLSLAKGQFSTGGGRAEE